VIRPLHVRVLVLAGLACAAALASLARGGEDASRSSAVEIVLSVNSIELSGEFKTPWQVAWIPGGSKIGLAAFTDRAGNQVGLLDLTTEKTQAIHLNVITNPNPIVVIDQTRFAIAGTGGVGIFDRSGTGTIRELQMAGTRNTVLALGPDNKLFVADAQLNDLRIIRPPYGGPADITKFALPSQCRGPTGVIPEASTITVLCGQTNNIVRIDYTGNFGSSTPLPLPNMGAQEARPSPNGFVFSAFNANRVLSFSSSYTNRFKSFSFGGPAVPTVGLFGDPAYKAKTAAAARALALGRRPKKEFFFAAWTPSYRDGRSSLGLFPAGTRRMFSNLSGRNLVGSANGPNGSILVADATPGKPAIHRVSFADPKGTRTRTGYSYRGYRLTAVDPEFIQRMTLPFFGPGPFPKSPPPKEVQVGIVGASSSPWNLKPTFSANFDLKVTATGKLSGGGTYKAKAASADTGPYTRVMRITNIRANTSQLSLELRGKTEVPVTFLVSAQAIRG